ncbi:hypothetical protein [Desulfosporosinus lacus]|uniref:hypothetical protein n=1 Tax=Desulfosporosinus lacus TaxID=329936 RepID=UPI000933EFA9|nr:hypothetical protein [Desulfosporosinus lacus]
MAKKAKATTKKVLTIKVIEINQPSTAACAAFNKRINEIAAKYFSTPKQATTKHLSNKRVIQL